MTKQSRKFLKSPYFSIVIPVHNEEAHIASCLRSIINSNYDIYAYEVIVVDNGSQDRSYEIALNFGNTVVTQLPVGNVGAVRNYGAAQARGEVLIFIDADCLIDSEWLNRAEKVIKAQPNRAYGGGAELPSNATWIEKSWLLQNKGQPTLPKQLIGASTILSKEIFLKIGTFDESLSSGEDTALHNKLISENVPVFIDHAFNVKHMGNAKTSKQFIKRQIWHSENYIANFTTSVGDLIFLLTLAFLALPLVIIVMGFFSPSVDKTIIILLIWILIPAILSLKRILRARQFHLPLKSLLKIYYLDFLYLTGRSLGLLKGILNLTK